MASQQHYKIELVEENEKVNFYSIHLDGKELTELESFFEKFPIGCEYDEEIDVIIAWMDKIAETGALERYFRPEGRYGDGVGVIPIDIGNKVRLYCLRLSDKILIFGNGGVKDTRTYNEDTELSGYVINLQKLDALLRDDIEKGIVVIESTDIIGADDKAYDV